MFCAGDVDGFCAGDVDGEAASSVWLPLPDRAADQPFRGLGVAGCSLDRRRAGEWAVLGCEANAVAVGFDPSCCRVPRSAGVRAGGSWSECASEIRRGFGDGVVDACVEGAFDPAGGVGAWGCVGLELEQQMQRPVVEVVGPLSMWCGAVWTVLSSGGGDESRRTPSQTARCPLMRPRSCTASRRRTTAARPARLTAPRAQLRSTLPHCRSRSERVTTLS